ncbi:MAG: helix-turn-helix domain-containing protein [Planctomycetota bacterium]
MTGKESVTNKPTGQTLGEYLANVRTSKQLSLREVEEAAGGIVSNAYLSQLEHGRINKPSPNILHSLAQVYGVPYETLMEKAGYIAASTSDQTASRRHGRVATFAKDNLTNEEEEALLEYLAFLRSKKGKRSP